MADFFECSTDYLLGRLDSERENLVIDTFVEHSGFSKHSTESMFSRTLFSKSDNIEYFDRLLMCERPPVDVSPFLPPEGKENFTADEMVSNPEYRNFPILSALIDCVDFDRIDDASVNLLTPMGICAEVEDAKKIVRAMKFAYLYSLIESYHDFMRKKTGGK